MPEELALDLPLLEELLEELEELLDELVELLDELEELEELELLVDLPLELELLDVVELVVLLDELGGDPPIGSAPSQAPRASKQVSKKVW